MLCQEAHELMSAELDGALAPAEQSALALHLGGCAACPAWRESVRGIERRLREPSRRQVTAPAALYTRLAEVEAGSARRSDAGAVSIHRTRPALSLALALCGAVGLGAALLLVLRPDRPATPISAGDDTHQIDAGQHAPSFGDCRVARGDSPVARACTQGGLKLAKATMKEMIKRGNEVGMRYECDDCHLDDNQFDRLTDNAKGNFRKLVAAVGGG